MSNENKKHYLDYWRARKGYSLSELSEQIEKAASVFFSKSALSRYEKSDAELPQKIIEPASKALHITEDELVHGPHHAQKGKSVTASDESKIGNAIETPLWEKLAAIIAKPSQGDMEMIDGLESVTRTYWELRSTVGYQDLFHAYAGHMETILSLLKGSHTSHMHARLCGLASDVGQRIGAIMFDKNQFGTAMHYYQVAKEAALEGENFLLAAVCLGKMSSLPIYSNKALEALPLLREGKMHAQKQGARTTKAWLAAVQAEAYAKLGNVSACMRELEEAEVELSKDGPDMLYYETHFDEGRLYGYKGACLLLLNKPSDAIVALDKGISILPSKFARQHAIMYADKAIASSLTGELELSCGFAIEALKLSQRTKSDLVLQRVNTFRQGTAKWNGSPIIKEFDSMMEAYAPRG
ncbi:MAG: helix-turn-helix transcriptional regulator [Ktedonobacterales bacterium]|nr:helix-turn-helix transcriptional regulator [Ktedonobacterales bacterium]